MELSIIIPVYNTAKYLQRCFDSISPLMTIFSGEIIFVDDGSTDDSPRLMLELSKSHKFVKVLTQSNKGLSGARNTGIKNVKSDCFILLDSDDWINHKNIEDLIRFFLINNLDLLSYRLESFNDNLESLGLRVKHPIPYNTVLSGREFLKEGYQPSSSCLFIYNRNFVINNNLFFSENITQEDVEFTTRLMIEAQKVIFSDVVVYNYFRHIGTLTMPSSNDKLKRYLSDSVIVANLIKENNVIRQFSDSELIDAIQKNYNSVTWNLIWRFLNKPNEVDSEFKLKCIAELKQKQLYPIKGALKSNFQRITRLFFNQEWLLKLMIQR